MTAAAPESSSSAAADPTKEPLAVVEGEYEGEEVALFGRKSPISRISHGGSVYPEPADSPNSFASLDDQDIGVKTPGASVCLFRCLSVFLFIVRVSDFNLFVQIGTRIVSL